MSPTIRLKTTMYRAAVVDLIKNQTRRVVVPQPGSDINPVMFDERSGVNYCFQWHSKESRREPTYGPPGTILPVVTTWAVHRTLDAFKPSEITEVPDQGLLSGIWWDDGTPKPEWAGKSRPAMFFPKHLYPLARQAKVVSVKAERVKSISREDAIAEGVNWRECPTFQTPAQIERMIAGGGHSTTIDYIGGYARLWDSINQDRGKGALKGQYAWTRNPWVFATTFEVLPPSHKATEDTSLPTE
jgi:hypothetical protein